MSDCYYIRVHVVTFTSFVFFHSYSRFLSEVRKVKRKLESRLYFFKFIITMDMELINITAVALVERPSSADLGVQLVDSERSGRKTQSDLVELATQIQTADAFTRSNVCNKLQVIADQVRFLHEQARRILEETKEAENLHHLACNFKKIPGKVYYLYQRTSGQKYFSMLSPEEWGTSCPHTFLGGYRLEADMSWTPTSKVEKKDNELRLINQILDGNKSVSAAIDMDRKIPQGQITFN